MEMKNEKQNQKAYDFTLDIRKKIVAWFLAEDKALEENFGFVRSEYFENQFLRDLMTLIIKFFNKYSRQPTEDELLQELDTFLGKLGKDKRFLSDE